MLHGLHALVCSRAVSGGRCSQVRPAVAKDRHSRAHPQPPNPAGMGRGSSSARSEVRQSVKVRRRTVGSVLGAAMPNNCMLQCSALHHVDTL